MLDKAVYAQGRPGGIFNVRNNVNLRIMKTIINEKYALNYLKDLGEKTVSTGPWSGGGAVIRSFSRRCWQSGITATERSTLTGSSLDQG